MPLIVSDKNTLAIHISTMHHYTPYIQPAMYFCILGYFYPMGGAVIISVLYVCTQFF